MYRKDLINDGFQCNITTNDSAYSHVIHLKNRTDEIAGSIKKDGHYKVIIKSCSLQNQGCMIDFFYSNPIALLCADEKFCQNTFTILLILSLVLFVVMLFNISLSFSIKNIICISYTIYLFLYFLEKIFFLSYYNLMSRSRDAKLNTNFIFLVFLRNLFYSVTLFLIAFQYCNIYENDILSILFFCMGAVIFNSILRFDSELYLLFNYSQYSLLITPLMGTAINNWCALFFVLTFNQSFGNEIVFKDTLYILFVNDLISFIIRAGSLILQCSCQNKITAVIYIIRAFFMPIIANKIVKNKKRRQFYYFRSITSRNITSYNIKTIWIPPHIIEIEDYAFCQCKMLTKVNFSLMSHLQKIGKFAFANTSISNITIPANVQKINEGLFANCKNLKSVDFSSGSLLTTIDSTAFCASSIEKLTIPSNVIELKVGWCINTPKLNDIYISTYNPNLFYYDDSYIIDKRTKENLLFSRRNIQKIVISSFIKRISPFAFDHCKEMQKIEFEKSSKLQMIYQYAFYNSSISSISIPESVTQIFQNAFDKCKQLTKIEFSEKTKINVFSSGIFSHTQIEKIYVPSSIQIIGEKVFYDSKKLRKIIFDENSELKIIEDHAFENTSLTSFVFPLHVIRVSENIFDNCINIQIVEFPDNFAPPLTNLKNIFKSCPNVKLMINPNSCDILHFFSNNFIC